MQSAGLFVFVQKKTHLKNNFTSITRRTPSDWLYEINKVLVYSLHVRFIPAYHRYVSSSIGIVDQIEVDVIIIIIIIIASVNASDKTVSV